MAKSKLKLKTPAPAAPTAPAAGAPAQKGQPLDISKLSLGPLLKQKLNINDAQVAQLMNALRTVKTSQEAVALIKSFDHNPATMNQPIPQATPQAPQAGAPGVAV